MKIRLAKQAWKSIKTTIQEKLKNPIKKSIRTLTTLPHIRPFISHQVKPRRFSIHHNLPKPIYVDELFPEKILKDEIHKIYMKTEQKQSLALKSCIKDCETSTRATNLEIFAKVKGIDERAEEFIIKFKEDMKIEREQSLLDFQEMLARSV